MTENFGGGNALALVSTDWSRTVRMTVHDDGKRFEERFGKRFAAGDGRGCGVVLLLNLPNLGPLDKSSVLPIVFSDDSIKIDAQ